MRLANELTGFALECSLGVFMVHAGPPSDAEQLLRETLGLSLTDPVKVGGGVPLFRFQQLDIAAGEIRRVP